MFIIKYQIVGFAGVQEAGPYITQEIAEQHRADLAGYEGVHDVQIEEVPAPAPKSVWDRLVADDE